MKRAHDFIYIWKSNLKDCRLVVSYIYKGSNDKKLKILKGTLKDQWVSFISAHFKRCFCKYKHFYIVSTQLSDKGDQNVLSNYTI